MNAKQNMQTEKYILSYSYSHLHSSSGKRLRILNKNFLIKDGWKILTSCISISEEKNVEQIPTWIDRSFKPISYSNTPSRRGIKSFFLHFLWPDKGIFWAIKASIRLYLQISRDSLTYKLVCVSYPFSSHLVGAFLKFCFPKRVILITHFIDAFYLINKGNGAPKFLAPLSLLSEIFTYKMADRIIINSSKKSEFESYFSKYSSKCISVDELPGIYLTPTFRNDDDSRSRCLFAGSLYKNIRNPDKVIDLFLELPELNLKIAGNLNDCTHILNKKHFEYLGLLNEEQIIKELNKADILINIDNQDINQQPPGKIIEYMQLQKPIINFFLNKSISGASLNKYSINPSSFIEIDLNDSKEINIKKIKSFNPPKKQLFEVTNNFEVVFRLYNYEKDI